MMTVETDPDDATDSQAQVVTSHDIEHSLLESVTCHKTAQTSSSQQCRYAVRWPTPQCVTRNVSRGSEDTSLAEFRWQQSGELEAYSDADWGGDKATRRSVSGGSS